MKKYFLIPILYIGLLFGQDPVANFAIGKLSAGINSSATLIILNSGQGARFPLTAAGDFNATIWDFSAYGWNITNAYLNSAAEIVRVTSNSGDSMVITRAQEGTTARSFNDSKKVYYIQLGVTAKTITDLQNAGEIQYVAPLLQSGTSAPSVYGSIFKNNTGSAITFTREDVGEYTLHITPTVSSNMLIDISNLAFYSAGTLYTIIVRNGGDGTNVVVGTFADGVASDGILGGIYENVISITIY